MGRALRVAALAVVVGMGVPPWLELDAIPGDSRRLLASALVLLALALGAWGALRREPIAARVTTIVYGSAFLGLGLFVTGRPLTELLAYVTGLIGMNVLLYHERAYGSILAEFREEDAIARRTRWVILRALAVSGGALALAYGGSFALLPLFAIDVGSQDPIVALVLAIGLLLVLLLLARLPEPLWLRRPSRRAP